MFTNIRTPASVYNVFKTGVQNVHVTWVFNSYCANSDNLCDIIHRFVKEIIMELIKYQILLRNQTSIKFENTVSCTFYWRFKRYVTSNYHDYATRLSASYLLSDFINLTQVHNFTVSAQDIFTFRRFSVFTVNFTRILQELMQIMKLFALYY